MSSTQNRRPVGSRRSRRRLVLLSSTVCLLIAALSAATVPVAARTGGVNGRIAFARATPDRQDDVAYIADSDGTNLRELLPGFTSGSPHWSPDGREVAVISGLGTTCPPACTGNTVIVNATSGTYRVLASQGYPPVGTFCSIWSPDATHFLCEGGNDDNPAVNGVYTIRSSDGGGLTRITNAGGMGDVPIDYSPDGRQIVFGRTSFHDCSAKSAIYVVNVDGSGLRRITPWGFCDDDGSWSPDGTRIAFVKPDGSIFTVHPDGTGLAQLALQTFGRSFAGDVTWSPDGRRIIFILTIQTGPHSFQEGLGTADADGTNVRQITVSSTFDHSADWGAVVNP
jgi:Tol biopolymer transport system component